MNHPSLIGSRRFWYGLILIALAGIMGGCDAERQAGDGEERDPTEPSDPTQPVVPVLPEDFQGTDWYFDGDTVEEVPAGTREAEAGGDSMHGIAGAFASDASGAAGPPAGPPGEGESTSLSFADIPAGQLTAGNFVDLDHWDFFTGVLADEAWSGMVDYWGFTPFGRVPVVVESSEGPVANAVVTLVDGSGLNLWQTRTNLGGEAELFAGMFTAAEGPFVVRVETNGGSRNIELPALPVEAPLVVELEDSPSAELALDLMFVIDTTGSMSDELSYIQAELADVIEQVRRNIASELPVRLSVSFYRDSGDAYVVRSYPFATDIDVAVAALGAQSANGGGDFPEAVDRALQIAVQKQSWDSEATTRLLFLVLDAPPHHEDEGVVERIQSLTRLAAAQGIAIMPVSASGIDKETEFLLRFMAIATNGSYSFITDHSGIGGPHLDPNPTIGDHEIELLNELVVRLITERLEPNH